MVPRHHSCYFISYTWWSRSLTDPLHRYQPFLEYNTLLTTFGAQHLLMLVFTAGAAWTLPLYAKDFMSAHERLLVFVARCARAVALVPPGV